MNLSKKVGGVVVLASTIYTVSAFGASNYAQAGMTSYGSTKQHKRGNSQEEKRNLAKDIAGTLLNVSGARQVIEYIDKKNKEEGFYKKQRRKAEEQRRKNKRKK